MPVGDESAPAGAGLRHQSGRCAANYCVMQRGAGLRDALGCAAFINGACSDKVQAERRRRLERNTDRNAIAAESVDELLFRGMID